MTGEDRLLTEPERIEDAFDELAALREHARLLARSAGPEASRIFAQIDDDLQVEMEQARPRTRMLAGIAFRLKLLVLSAQPY
jgi:hypothetical protein